jgi:hypothetical protein
VRMRDSQPDSREGPAGPTGVAERPVVVPKPGNAGGAKGPWVKVNVGSGENQESGVSLIPPRTVEKLQATLHAKAKGSPDNRLYRRRWLDEVTEEHARQRVRQWLRRKHKVQGRGYSRFPDEYLHGELGLVQLRLCERNVPWANA